LKREQPNTAANGQFLASASTVDMLIEYPTRTTAQYLSVFSAKYPENGKEPYADESPDPATKPTHATVPVEDLALHDVDPL